jgi:hypothetical protein
MSDKSGFTASLKTEKGAIRLRLFMLTYPGCLPQSNRMWPSGAVSFRNGHNPGMGYYPYEDV